MRSKFEWDLSYEWLIWFDIGPGTYAAEKKVSGPMKDMMSNSFSTKVSNSFYQKFITKLMSFRFQGSAQLRPDQAVTSHRPTWQILDLEHISKVSNSQESHQIWTKLEPSTLPTNIKTRWTSSVQSLHQFQARKSIRICTLEEVSIPLDQLFIIQTHKHRRKELLSATFRPQNRLVRFSSPP